MPLNGFVTQTQQNVDPAANVQKPAFRSMKKKVDDKIGSCREK